MEIGNMNQRITILENHAKTDSIGNHLNVWEEIVSCWAEVKIRNLQSSSEKTDTGVTREIRTVVFTVRQSPNLCYINSTTHKILFRNKIYNIISVWVDFAKGGYMAINCEIHEAGVKDDIY